MAIIKLNSSGGSKSLNSSEGLIAVRVKDIILDINHPLAEQYGNYDAIGTIFYSKLDTSGISNPKDDPTAVPLFSHLKYYPLINEIVLIITTYDKAIYDYGKQSTTYYFPQINMWGHPHHNALPALEDLELSKSVNDYKETEGGLVRKSEDGSTDIKLGLYFKEKLNIKPLLPYEGDMILEGRFGNSIRFGSTNNNSEISNPNGWSENGITGDPITIIRNGQSSTLDEKGWLPTIENINDDASSIYLTSNQIIQNFRQASMYMDSWGAQYIEPQTIEQLLLDPTPTSFIPPITKPSLPSSNEDTGIIANILLPEPEKLEIDEIINNPQTSNEVVSQIESTQMTPNTEVILPNSYNPNLVGVNTTQTATSNSDVVKEVTNPYHKIKKKSNGGGGGGGSTMQYDVTNY
jgi:hypothetical protein